jgi:hypothetical protein
VHKEEQATQILRDLQEHAALRSIRIGGKARKLAIEELSRRLPQSEEEAAHLAIKITNNAPEYALMARRQLRRTQSKVLQISDVRAMFAIFDKCCPVL